MHHGVTFNFCLTALKISRSFYYFANSLSHGVENYFPRVWSMGISHAIFCFCESKIFFKLPIVH